MLPIVRLWAIGALLVFLGITAYEIHLTIATTESVFQTLYVYFLIMFGVYLLFALFLLCVSVVLEYREEETKAKEDEQQAFFEELRRRAYQSARLD